MHAVKKEQKNIIKKKIHGEVHVKDRRAARGKQRGCSKAIQANNDGANKFTYFDCL